MPANEMLKILFCLLFFAACRPDQDNSNLQSKSPSRLGILQGSLMREIETIACPEPTNIKARAVPTSYHSIYSAESGSFVFSDLDLEGVDTHRLSFSKAQVLQTGDVWRLLCEYRGFTSLQNLHLATNSDSLLGQCFFPEGTTQCTQSIQDCLFVCPKRHPRMRTLEAY